MATKTAAVLESAVNRQRPRPEEIRQQIAETAYYRALGRGFAPGYEVDDWLAAEMQVTNGAAKTS